MEWKHALKSRLAAGTEPERNEQELKDEEMELFTKYYMEWKGGQKHANTSYMNIPRFYYREPFPALMEGEQPGKSKSSGRAPRGPTWTDEETRVLLGHWNTLLVQRRVQNMPNNSDLYAILAQKMAEEGFLRTRIQCNNRIRDLRKAYRKAKDAMSRAGSMPVRCRFFRELDEICGGGTETVPSSISQTMKLQSSTIMVQPGPSWEPMPETSWKMEEVSESESAFDRIGDTTQPMQEVLKIKMESELEEATTFQLPLQPVSSSPASTVAIAPTLEEEQQSTFQEPDILMPSRPTATHAPQLSSPTNLSEQRLKTGIQDKDDIGRPRCDSEGAQRPSVGRMAQLRVRRRQARKKTIGCLLEEIRAGREAMDTAFHLFLEQQRSFQNSLIREMRLARREQRRAAEAELRARQEEWQHQRTQHVLDANRSDAEIVHFRQELCLLRHTFEEFFSAMRPFLPVSQVKTPSPVLAHRETSGLSVSQWECSTLPVFQEQAPLPNPHVLGAPSRGRRGGRPRRRGGCTRK